MTRIPLHELVGDFAEDKDVAGQLRNDRILPALETGDAVEIDFGGITLATQSFMHALIAEALRRHGEACLDRLVFKDCSPLVRGIIETVVQYVLETAENEHAQA
jgi:hypothetical protein